MTTFRTIRGFHEENGGYILGEGKWTGAISTIDGWKLIELSGDRAFRAYEEATKYPIISARLVREMATTTGDVAMVPGQGAPPPSPQKKRKKKGELILGDAEDSQPSE